MGITAIKSVANRDLVVTYAIRNLENPNDTGGPGNALNVTPGQSRSVNMWIPWCNNLSDFSNQHRIIFDALGTLQQGLPSAPDSLVAPNSFTVWQRGDYVYYSLDDRFETGQLVPGNSTVNGDRSVEITSTWIRFH